MMTTLPGVEQLALDVGAAGTVPARPVLRYPGSKWGLARQIIAQFPAHWHYIEPFFGSGAIFFTKPPSRHEVLNDIDGQIVNLFRVIREEADALAWAVETTPWARSEYVAARGPVEPNVDAIEQARRFLAACWQAHAADLSSAAGWRHRGVNDRSAGMTHRWMQLPAQIQKIAGRLRDAEIECVDAIELIQRSNSPDTLVYADPPYMRSTRAGTLYRHEYDDADHERLLDALDAHRGPVVLSGYANEMYDDRLGTGWNRIELAPPHTEKGGCRTEILWVRPAT